MAVSESRRGADSAALVSLLQCPRTYPDGPAVVEMVETHISWVFLTSRHAYKLKKPVRFDFLDFSSPQLRRTACENEVQLNRRLAPDVYLGVVPITQDGTALRLGGKGVPVDWVVKMRRLPRDGALDVRIREQSLTDRDVLAVAKALTDFYLQLPPVAVQTESYLREWERHLQGNREELLRPVHQLDADLVQLAHLRQQRLVRLAPDLFRNRVLDGRIIEGHGDLRPEHIYLQDGVACIIDCIEFNRAFRILDVADELSFLALECTVLGEKGVGGQILDAYCRASGDVPSGLLLSFYLCYRACVRAKVQAIRAAQLPAGDGAEEFRRAAGKYLQLAGEYARDLGPPFLLIVRGLMGTGKTTLSLALQQSLEVPLIQTDAVRRELLGTSDGHVRYGEQNYTVENRQSVYEEMFRRAAARLAKGHSVILDGTFLSRSLRARAASLARRLQAIPLVLHCRCPDETAKERIAARIARGDTLSEARPDLFDRQRQEEESDPAGIVACDIDTTQTPPEMLKAVYDLLRGLLVGEHGLRSDLTSPRTR